jgi:arylsulfatase A-like enzyme
MSRPHSKHVVLIVFDYMGYCDIELFGQSEIRTLKLRRLAEQGIRHTDFYAPAPICVPSRAAVPNNGLTGMVNLG